MEAIGPTTTLAKTMEQACEVHAPVMITGSKAASVVMISPAGYEAPQETAYLLRAPKPEPLGYSLSGCWSRRITDEHRIVYKVTDDALSIAQLRYHD